MNLTIIEVIEGLIILLLVFLLIYGRRENIKEVDENQKAYNDLYKDSSKNEAFISFLVGLLSSPPVSVINGTTKKEVFEIKQHGVTSNKVKIDGKWAKVPGEIFYYSKDNKKYISALDIRGVKDLPVHLMKNLYEDLRTLNP